MFCHCPFPPQLWGIPVELHCLSTPGLHTPVQPAVVLQTFEHVTGVGIEQAPLPSQFPAA
jgi:hypothetical protein